MAPRTKEELLSFSVIDPALAAALKKGPPNRIPQPTDPYYGQTGHSALRAHRAAVLKEKWPLRYLPGPIPEVEEKDWKVPVRDGAEIRVRIYTPVLKKEGGSPLIVMFHEGGWGMGDLSDEEVNCRKFGVVIPLCRKFWEPWK